MFNKIAVVLRGHVRTWHQISQYAFKDYSKISKSVDYYFVTWDILGLDEDRIINSFKGQNLVKFLKVSKENHYNNTYGPSWLANCISKYFINDSYDAVIETRPDIIPFFNPRNTFIFSGPLHIIWESPININNNTILGISDTFQIMSVDVFKIYCTRYQKEKKINSHVSLRDFYLENKIDLKLIDNLCGPDIVRPTAIDLIDSTEYTNKKHWINAWHLWYKISDQEKIKMLKQYNILLEDYDLKLK
jgi:hypothetical protein